MLAKVIAETTVHNTPCAVGDIVEVDENTFRNLAAKGRLEEATEGEQEDPAKEELTQEKAPDQGGDPAADPESEAKPKGKGKGKGKA